MFSLYQPITFIEAHCELIYKRAAKMNQKAIASLRAESLYRVSCSSPSNRIAHAVQCIKQKQCFYLTFDSQNNICTLYNQGSTFYNTTSLQTYVLDLPSKAVLFVFVNIDVNRVIKSRNLTSIIKHFVALQYH